MRAAVGPEERIANRDRVAELRDVYGSLLTARQREMLAWYYEYDLSLGEIAEQAGVSRQAVHDLLRRAVSLLEGYERRLGFTQRSALRKKTALSLLGEIEAALRTDGETRLAALRSAAGLAERILDD